MVGILIVVFLFMVGMMILVEIVVVVRMDIMLWFVFFESD